ncbi:hypothetical protein GKJPGBOP_05443 [Streptomyces paromomycinus]|uniref:Uncharacterized protein n=1 Tax=Streptomyces paromomycinus TaxID=92743 RepID=A0A401W8Q9_STREY|nr:hypothetical protein GKJPGBOP_05443 [Streptomyces paromomycinus]
MYDCEGCGRSRRGLFFGPGAGEVQWRCWRCRQHDHPLLGLLVEVVEFLFVPVTAVRAAQEPVHFAPRTGRSAAARFRRCQTAYSWRT